MIWSRTARRRVWVTFRSIDFLRGIESRSGYVSLEVAESVCINEVITVILLCNFPCCTFCVVALVTVRRLWRRLNMLDKCSVVNIDI